MVIHELRRSGLGDHAGFSVCFQSARQTIEKIIDRRKLVSVQNRNPNDEGSIQAKSCVGEGGVHYSRVLDGGSSTERVNGFGTTTQLLVYDEQRQKAFYLFAGLD